MAATLRRPRRVYPVHHSESLDPGQHRRNSKGYALPTLLLLFGASFIWAGYQIHSPFQLLPAKTTPNANFDFKLLRDAKHVMNESKFLPIQGDDKGNEASFYGETSLTAIFPISHGTVEDIYGILAPIFVEETSLTTIILLVPAELEALVETVLNGINSAFVDIDVKKWSVHMDECEAILDIVLRVEADYVLVMDRNGLSGLDIETQDRLLVHPLLLDLPDGPCGASNAVANSTCLVPSAEPQKASFILPPFLSPTFLMKNYSMYNHQSGLKGWHAMGEWIAKDRDGIGGIVRGPGDASITGCVSRCIANDVTVSEELVQSELADERNHSVGHLHSLSQANQPSIVIVLPTIDDLKSLSSAACRMFTNGADIHILILSNLNGLKDETPRAGAYPWLHDQLIQHGCRLSFSSLHSSSNEYANAEAASYWLSIVAARDSIIIFGVSSNEYRLFEAEVDKTRATGTIVIKVPVEDLSLADWIGSLSTSELRKWHEPKIEISIVTDDRPQSLTRLLASLKNAVYFGDIVNLRINMEQTASQQTIRIVNDFKWDFGGLAVYHRVVHGGLLPAVTESWYPHSNDSYGIILEDDTEASPLFYAWAKMAVLRYRYGKSTNRSPSLFGISLYQQKNLELRLEGRRPFNARSLFDAHGFEHRNTPFLSQIPCSWGAVYFPEHWREFHSYLTLRFSEYVILMDELVVPHVRSNRWTRSWKKFFIELAYLRGYVMLYPNYDDYVSLSTNHLELGSHVKQLPKELYERKKELFTLPLLQPARGAVGSSGLLDLPHERLPPWLGLPILDLVGLVTSSRQLITRGDQRQQELSGCSTMASNPTRRWSFDVQDLFRCKTQATNENSD